jgi:hypothetical protein
VFDLLLRRRERALQDIPGTGISARHRGSPRKSAPKWLAVGRSLATCKASLALDQAAFIDAMVQLTARRETPRRRSSHHCSQMRGSLVINHLTRSRERPGATQPPHHVSGIAGYQSDSVERHSSLKRGFALAGGDGLRARSIASVVALAAPSYRKAVKRDFIRPGRPAEKPVIESFNACHKQLLE